MIDDKAELAADNSVIAEMTEDLTSGRRTPHEVMADQAVAAEFNKGVARFGQWFESLAEKEKQAAADATVGEQPRSEAGERSTLARRRPSAADDVPGHHS